MSPTNNIIDFSKYKDWKDALDDGLDHEIKTNHQMIIDNFLYKLDNDPELSRLFFNELRKRKIKKIKQK